MKEFVVSPCCWEIDAINSEVSWLRELITLREKTAVFFSFWRNVLGFPFHQSCLAELHRQRQRIFRIFQVHKLFLLWQYLQAETTSLIFALFQSILKTICIWAILKQYHKVPDLEDFFENSTDFFSTNENLQGLQLS